LADILKGFSSASGSISSKYFYDDIGSTLFDAICELDEYYPTRVELEIMHRYGDEVVPKSEFEPRRTYFYFPGSTIGNFAQAEAIQLLADIADRCERGDGLLIGFEQMTAQPSVDGKVQQAILILWLTVRPIRRQRGITQTPRKR